MKKVIKWGLGIFTVLVIAAFTIPFFVDVDQYRPEITRIANQHLNGKLELGKLELSLWGQIKIKIQGIKLTDLSQKSVLQVQEAYFHLPFSSIFSGSPNLVLNMKSPDIHLVKSKEGKWNLTELVKAQEKTAGSTSEEATGKNAVSGKGGKKGESVALPALATRARLSFDLTSAKLAMEDRMTGSTTKIQDLNLKVEDISLSRPLHFEMLAKIDAVQNAAEGNLLIEGPVSAKGMFEPKVSGTQFQGFKLEANLDASSLSIKKPGLFNKKPGVPFRAEVKAQGDSNQINLEKASLEFHTLKVDSKGKMSAGGERVAIDFATNSVDLKTLAEVLEEGSELSGKFSAKGKVEGPSEQLGFAGEIKLDGMSYKGPMMKNAAKVDLYVKATMEEVESLLLTLSAPGNQLKASGSIKNMMTSPLMAMKVSSEGLDLNQLFILPDPKAKKDEKKDEKKTEKKEVASNGAGKGDGKSQGSASQDGTPASEDTDRMIDPLRKNPRLAKFTAAIDVGIKTFKVYDVVLSSLSMKLKMKDLAASLEDLKFSLWEGTWAADFKTDLKPARPTYSFNANIQNLNIQRAVESQLALFKNTLLGKVSFQAKGSGASFVSTRAIPALNLQGKFNATDATFATIDIGKMVTEAVNGTISKVADKVPPLKGKTLKAVPNLNSKYQSIASDYSMSGGVFRAPNFVGKAIPNQGIDLSGNTTVNLVTEDLDAKWKLVDTYDLTKAKEISVDVAGQKIDSVLNEKGKPFTLPVSMGCKMKAPCMNYSEAPGELGRIALSNMTGAAKSKAKQVLQDKVQEQVKNKAPDAVKDILKKLPGGLFGN